MDNKSRYIKNDIFIGIVSKQEFLQINKILKDNQKANIALISIHEPDNEGHKDEIVAGYKDVLQISFWDIESDLLQYKTISKSQGKRIKDFIIKNIDSKFLIHCAAGVSRSAGVGMAVECLKLYNGNKYNYQTSKSDIKEHWRYSPNRTVFDAIMDS
jgi:predicted protein tyrosine phosphatase